MSSPSPINGHEAGRVECARLIPGAMAHFRENAKKPPGTVRPFGNPGPDLVPPLDGCSRENPLTLLLPFPLLSRGGPWVRSVVSDFALVGLNWLLVGAALVPLRHLFPRIRIFDYAAGTPAFLLGLALLHAALITLVGYTEGLYASRDAPGQVRILAKSVLLATTLLVLVYGMQGAPWTRSGLFCAAALMHFGALGVWRWQMRERSGEPRPPNLRNVLIVGAGPTGRL